MPGSTCRSAVRCVVYRPVTCPSARRTRGRAHSGVSATTNRLRKGDRVHVLGELQHRAWVDSDGAQQATTDCSPGATQSYEIIVIGDFLK